MRTSSYRTEYVDHIPKVIEEGVLYVSEPFSFVAHLCACGCGNKVNTPIGPTDWKLYQHNGTASLYPSIGNWSFACRSHYFIEHGRVKWAGQMSNRQIAKGRAYDQEVQQQYYQLPKSGGSRFVYWLKKLFGSK